MRPDLGCRHGQFLRITPYDLVRTSDAEAEALVPAFPWNKIHSSLYDGVVARSLKIWGAKDVW
jgi:hypothetical protein